MRNDSHPEEFFGLRRSFLALQKMILLALYLSQQCLKITIRILITIPLYRCTNNCIIQLSTVSKNERKVNENSIFT